MGRVHSLHLLYRKKGVPFIAIKEDTEMLVVVVTMMGFQVFWIHAPGSGGQVEEELGNTLSSVLEKSASISPEQEREAVRLEHSGGENGKIKNSRQQGGGE